MAWPRPIARLPPTGEPAYDPHRVIAFPLYLEVDEIYNLACPASPIHYQRDPMQRQPDIAKARDVLDWQPGVALETGLLRTIDYFHARLA